MASSVSTPGQVGEKATWTRPWRTVMLPKGRGAGGALRPRRRWTSERCCHVFRVGPSQGGSGGKACERVEGNRGWVDVGVLILAGRQVSFRVEELGKVLDCSGFSSGLRCVVMLRRSARRWSRRMVKAQLRSARRARSSAWLG